MTQLPGKNLVRSISTRSLIATLGVSLCMAGCFGDSPESLMASARKHIEAKDSKTAVIELKNVLQQQPENAEGRFLLGKLLLDSGEAVSALVELQKAQELGYDPERLNPVLARAMLNNGNAQAVVSTFAGKSLKAPGAQADLQATLAEAYIQLRKPAEAEAAVAAARRLNPHVDAHAVCQRIDATSIAPLLADADVVLDGCDNFATRLAVADAAYAARVPLVSAAIGQFDGQLGVFRGWEADKPCYRCFVGDDPERAGVSCSEDGVLGPMAGMIGSLAALEVLRKDPPQAMSILGDGFALANRAVMINTATELRIPVISAWRVFAESGAVCTFGPALEACYRRLAYFVDRVLKGAAPADLPIEQPTQFETVFNLKAAQALGLLLPPKVLAQADSVIDS